MPTSVGNTPDQLCFVGKRWQTVLHDRQTSGDRGDALTELEKLILFGGPFDGVYYVLVTVL
jgi:hypothetical protein